MYYSLRATRLPLKISQSLKFLATVVGFGKILQLIGFFMQDSRSQLPWEIWRQGSYELSENY